MKNVIISVESRKGGVGKTTAALCMGKILHERDYAVLLIDTDITGTNVANFRDSPFWHDNLINILKITENENKEEGANLLRLFEEKFMNGDEVPSFRSSNSDNGFNSNIDRINIIGSQIYSQDGKTEVICKPTILFDQLHAYWFVDFLKELIEDFAATAGDKPVAVVLDNSPGYVGIAPAIQDWLTDLGPDTGKFLMVTSLDNQDMKSCEMAISVLHGQYKDKFNTGCMFKKAKNGNGDNLNHSLMKSDFFVKLIEHDESHSNQITRFTVPLKFYIECTDVGKSYSQSPKKYLAAIVNKVPRTVIKHRRTYQPDISSNKESLLLNLLGGQYSRKWSRYMVGYDPYIEFQFFQSGMSKKRYRKKSNRILDRLLKKEEMFYDKSFLHLKDMFSLKSNIPINEYISQFQDIINRSIEIMRTNGLDHLADLIDEDWQPKSIVANLRTAYYNLMAISDYPFREAYLDGFVNERMMQKKRLHIFREFVDNLSTSFEKLKKFPELRYAVFYLIFSLPIGQTNRLDKEFRSFFRTLIKLELKLIENADSKDRNLLRILTTKATNNKMRIKKLLNNSRFSKQFIYRSDNEFIDFFQTFMFAQARLIKLSEDTRFLISLIREMVEFESKTPNALPYVRKIAENVIIHKTLTYDAVRGELSKALSDAQYFADFDKVIKNIVKSWELEK